MTNINRLLDNIRKEYGPKVEKAFADAIADIRNDTVLRRLIEAIERGDINTAIAVLDINETVFASMRQQMVNAYSSAGAAVIGAVKFDPPNRTTGVVRWNVTNPTAERFIRETIGNHITNITEQTVAGVRERLLGGYAQGQGPRQMALNIIGMVGANGKRTGGIVGLTAPQIRVADQIDSILADPDRYREYFTKDRVTGKLKPRWKSTNFNTNRAIMKAIREGKTLTAKQIASIKTANNNKMLRQRGEVIARTETPIAVAQARMDAYTIGMEKKGYPRMYANKEWLHGGGGMEPRDQHVAISRTVVQGLDTPFNMPDGTLMQYSHDPLGPIHQNANCTCTTQISIDYARMRRDGVI
jgi:hypothetical protein